MKYKLIDFYGFAKLELKVIEKSGTGKGHPRKISLFKKALAKRKE